MRRRYWLAYAQHRAGGERYLGKLLQTTRESALAMAGSRFGKALKEGERIAVFTQTSL